MNKSLPGLLLVAAAAAANPNVPKPPQTEPLLIEGAMIHTITGQSMANGRLLFPQPGEAIANGRLLVHEGRIHAVGGPNGVFIGGSLTGFDPETIRTLDLQGLHVYPGLISANTVLGLVEIEAVRATVDVAETGAINPSARAEIAINPDSENIPVARANGILAALTAPLTGGNLIAGRSAVIQLDGWTAEDMTIRAPVGMHITLPGLRIPDGLRESQRRQFIERRDEQLERLHSSFNDALAYRDAQAAGATSAIDRRWEAMLPVFAGTLPVFAHVNELSEIRYALNLAAEYDFRLVIVGGADAWRIADVLAAREIPVIIAGVHLPPARRWEGYSTPSENPVKLLAAGVRVAIANVGGTFVAPMERNLPYEAAEAVAWGLDPEEAIRMITLYPAQILGVADRLGSIEPGKDASFIVTDGNPLDIRTQVLRAFIQGREIDLSTRHTDLNAKYGERLNQIGLRP